MSHVVLLSSVLLPSVTCHWRVAWFNFSFAPLSHQWRCFVPLSCQWSCWMFNHIVIMFFFSIHRLTSSSKDPTRWLILPHAAHVEKVLLNWQRLVGSCVRRKRQQTKIGLVELPPSSLRRSQQPLTDGQEKEERHWFLTGKSNTTTWKGIWFNNLFKQMHPFGSSSNVPNLWHLESSVGVNSVSMRQMSRPEVDVQTRGGCASDTKTQFMCWHCASFKNGSCHVAENKSQRPGTEVWAHTFCCHTNQSKWHPQITCIPNREEISAKLHQQINTLNWNQNIFMHLNNAQWTLNQQLWVAPLLVLFCNAGGWTNDSNLLLSLGPDNCCQLFSPLGSPTCSTLPTPLETENSPFWSCGAVLKPTTRETNWAAKSPMRCKLGSVNTKALVTTACCCITLTPTHGNQSTTQVCECLQSAVAICNCTGHIHVPLGGIGNKWHNSDHFRIMMARKDQAWRASDSQEESSSLLFFCFCDHCEQHQI